MGMIKEDVVAKYLLAIPKLRKFILYKGFGYYVEDILQDTALAVIVNWYQFKGTTDKELGNWLLSIVHNNIKTKLRWKCRKEFVEIDSMEWNCLVDGRMGIEEYLDLRDKVREIREITETKVRPILRGNMLEYIDNWGEMCQLFQEVQR